MFCIYSLDVQTQVGEFLIKISVETEELKYSNEREA